MSTKINLYQIKLEYQVCSDTEPSYSDDSVLAFNAEDAVDTSKARVQDWLINEEKVDKDEILFIRLLECKLDYENIDIVSEALKIKGKES